MQHHANNGHSLRTWGQASPDPRASRPLRTWGQALPDPRASRPQGVGWKDGWAGRAVVTANVGYNEPHFFTLADADYVESFIVQWRQRVNDSISYRPASLLLHRLRSPSSARFTMHHRLLGNCTCGGNRARFSMASMTAFTSSCHSLRNA